MKRVVSGIFAAWVAGCLWGNAAEANSRVQVTHGRCLLMYSQFIRIKMLHSAFATSDGLAPNVSHPGLWVCASEAAAMPGEAAARALQKCEERLAAVRRQGDRIIQACAVIARF